METFITFIPPQLPQLMTAAQFASFLVDSYPELEEAEDTHLRELTAAMDAYEFACQEYQARNAHYAEWMKWYQENPSQKDKVVAFGIEHHVCFSSTRSALQLLDRAVVRLIEAWGDRNSVSAIHTILLNVEEEARKLAENLRLLQSAPGPSGQPQILPQKRSSSNR